jgi:hypothetical protein
MSKKHRTASKAKRRYHADPSAIYRLMSAHQDFTQDEQAALVVPARLAFERIKSGAGQEDDFHCLAAACNVSLVSAEKISPLVESACLMARDALLRCKERYTKTQRWGFDGPALGEIAEMLDVYEQLVGLLKPRQLQDAMTEVLRRSKNGAGLEQPEFQLENA